FGSGIGGTTNAPLKLTSTFFGPCIGSGCVRASSVFVIHPTPSRGCEIQELNSAVTYPIFPHLRRMRAPGSRCTSRAAPMRGNCRASLRFASSKRSPAVRRWCARPGRTLSRCLIQETTSLRFRPAKLCALRLCNSSAKRSNDDRGVRVAPRPLLRATPAPTVPNNWRPFASRSPPATLRPQPRCLRVQFDLGLLEWRCHLLSWHLQESPRSRLPHHLC